jgi:hypothetical protein
LIFWNNFLNFRSLQRDILSKTNFFLVCFITICVFVLHPYHSPVKTRVLSTGTMELHTLIGHGLIHSLAFALLSQRNTWKLWTGYNLKQSCTFRIVMHILINKNIYYFILKNAYFIRNITILISNKNMYI